MDEKKVKEISFDMFACIDKHLDEGTEYDTMMKAIVMFVAAMVKGKSSYEDAVKDFVIFNYNLHSTFVKMSLIDTENITNQ